MVSGAALIFIFNLLSGIVALLVSYYAFRFNRLVDSSILRSVSLGFMLLGVGLIVEAGITVLLGVSLVDLFLVRGVAIFGNVIFLVLQLIAYIAFALGYGAGAYGKPKRISEGSLLTSLSLLAVAGARPGLTEFYYFSLTSEFAIMFLIGFVVFQGILIYSRTHNNLSLMVLLGFVLILVSHVVRLDSLLVLSAIRYLDGAIIQFFGFIFLLVFLLRSGRVGSA